MCIRSFSLSRELSLVRICSLFIGKVMDWLNRASRHGDFLQVLLSAKGIFQSSSIPFFSNSWPRIVFFFIFLKEQGSLFSGAFQVHKRSLKKKVITPKEKFVFYFPYTYRKQIHFNQPIYNHSNNRLKSNAKKTEQFTYTKRS